MCDRTAEKRTPIYLVNRKTIIYINLILNKLLKGISSQREHLERFQCRDQVKLCWAQWCSTLPSMRLLGALCCQVLSLHVRLASLLPIVLLLQLLQLHCVFDVGFQRKAKTIQVR